MPPLPKPRPKPEYAIGARDLDQEIMGYLDNLAKLGYDPSVMNQSLDLNMLSRGMDYAYYVNPDKPLDEKTQRIFEARDKWAPGQFKHDNMYFGLKATENAPNTIAHESRHRGFNRVRAYLKEKEKDPNELKYYVDTANELNKSSDSNYSIMDTIIFLNTLREMPSSYEELMIGSKDSYGGEDPNRGGSNVTYDKLNEDQKDILNSLSASANGLAGLLYQQKIKEQIAKAKLKEALK